MTEIKSLVPDLSYCKLFDKYNLFNRSLFVIIDNWMGKKQFYGFRYNTQYGKYESRYSAPTTSEMISILPDDRTRIFKNRKNTCLTIDCDCNKQCEIEYVIVILDETKTDTLYSARNNKLENALAEIIIRMKRENDTINKIEK